MCGGAGVPSGSREESEIAVEKRDGARKPKDGYVRSIRASNQPIAFANENPVTVLPEAVPRPEMDAPVGEWLQDGLSDGLGGHTPRADELPDPAFIEVSATLHDVIFPNYWFERWASG
jgi:hypothetical protein